MIESTTLRSNTIPLTAANNNVFNARCVKVTNLSNNTVVITQSDPVANVQLSTAYIVSNDFMVITKNPSDFLASNNAANNVVAVSIGFTY
jgi:hypothetical protein